MRDDEYPQMAYREQMENLMMEVNRLKKENFALKEENLMMMGDLEENKKKLKFAENEILRENRKLGFDYGKSGFDS